MILNVKKLPVTVQAIEWTGDNLAEVLEFTGKHPKWDTWFSSFEQYESFVKNDRNVFKIKTLEGTHEANVGDFIIRGVNGEHYPCKPDIFHKTYVVANSLKTEIIKDIDMVVSKIVATLERTRQHSLAITKLEEANHWLKDIE